MSGHKQYGHEGGVGTYIRCPVGVRGVACAAVGLLYPGARTEPQEQRSFLLPGKVCLGALRQGPYNSRGGSGAPLGPLLLPMLLLLRLQVCGHVFVPKYVVWAESELTGGSEHKTFSVDLFGNGEGTCASGGGDHLLFNRCLQVCGHKSKCGHVFVPKYVVWAQSELTGGSEHKTFSVGLGKTPRF